LIATLSVAVRVILTADLYHSVPDPAVPDPRVPASANVVVGGVASSTMATSLNGPEAASATSDASCDGRFVGSE
jgi:hypothetical protein